MSGLVVGSVWTVVTVVSGLLIGLGVGPGLVAESELAIGSGLVVGSGLVSELDGPSLILMMSGFVSVSEY